MKEGAIIGAGLVFGVLAVSSPITNTDTVLTIFEKGGFLLLTLLSLFGFVWMVGPKVVNWLSSYLERLEQRNAENLSRFLDELKAQRESRELWLKELREILQIHKQEVVSSLREQTVAFKELVKVLSRYD